MYFFLLTISDLPNKFIVFPHRFKIIAPAINIYQFGYIVSQFDGNNNDKDDIAALPIAAALTNAKDLQQKSVFFYDDNVSESNINEQVQHMRAGAAFAEKLGIETVDYQADLSKANNRLVNIFNSGEKVLSLEGGPIETTYLALEQTNTENLKNITLVSHSYWNEHHNVGFSPDGVQPRTWQDIQNDFPEVNVLEIADQNGVWLGSDYDGDTGFQNDDWNWLDNTTNPVLKEARTLMANSGSKVNDPSDAGMHFFAFTGNETGDPNDAQQFFDANPPEFISNPETINKSYIVNDLHSEPPNTTPGSNNEVQLIFDTDMSNDVDDVNALAMIHALANKGEANLLAVVTNANAEHNRTASTVDVINTYYNRPDIPIGVTKVSGLQQDGSFYGGSMHTMFPHDTPSDDQVADAVDVLRETLAAAEDNSITYVSVGYLVNMASLLESGPDEHSILNGTDLVQQKVKEAVIMGGQYPDWGKEWNFSRNRPQDTQMVVDHWPTRIVFSGSEVGWQMYSGTSLQNAPTSNPVRYAEEVFKGFDTPNNAITDGYDSWDQTAVLWAVRGDEDLWSRVDNGFNQVNSDGSSQWQTGRDDSRQEYLVKMQDNSRYIDIVNDLYLVPPIGDPMTGAGAEVI